MITHSLNKRDDGKFEVHLYDRQIVYIGDTEQAVYDAALTGVGELCRVGHLDPSDPSAPGAGGSGRVGHLIALAAEAIAFNVKLSVGPDEGSRNLARNRLATLSTAMAALARSDLD